MRDLGESMLGQSLQKQYPDFFRYTLEVDLELRIR